jgi:hypothetical protein
MESVIKLFLYIARCHCLEVAKATNNHNHRQLNYSKTSHCYPIFGNTIPARREQLAELIL